MVCLHQTVSIKHAQLVVILWKHDGLRTVKGDLCHLVFLFHSVMSVSSLSVVVSMVVFSLDELVENTTLVAMLSLVGSNHEMIRFLHVHTFG